MRLVAALDLPEATPSNNVLKNAHFRAYATLRKRWRRMVAEALDCSGHEGGAGPVARAHLEIERYCSGSGLDWDNAYGGLKPLLDCLVAPSAQNPDGLGLILDDNPRDMPRAPTLTQHKAPRGAGRTVVRIYALD